MGEIFLKKILIYTLVLISLSLLTIIIINSTHNTKNNKISGLATHPIYTSFSFPENGFNFNNSTRTVSVSDSVIYKNAYYSINGEPWQSITLTGNYYNKETDWLENTATGTTPTLDKGEHYIITYSCTYNNSTNTWDCHGNKWQIIAINNTLNNNQITITFESPTPNNNATVTSSTQIITASITQTSEEDTSAWIDFDKSLIGYWGMDYYNNSGVYDNSTYNNFGKFEIGITTSDIITGIRGNAIKFKSDKIDCENGAWITVDKLIGTKAFNNSGQLTYSAWIKPETIVWSGIMGTETVKLHITTDNKIRVTMYNPSSTQRDSTPVITKGQWQHIAITYTKSTGILTIYHNGNIVGTSTVQNANLADNPGYFFIGQNWWDCFNGTIDEVMAFNRTLTPEEIKSLYNSKTNKFNAILTNLTNAKHTYNLYAIDSSGNTANTGTRTFTVNAVNPVSCFDNIKNQNEVFTDCGGVCPACECLTSQTTNCNITYGTGSWTRNCIDGKYGSWSTCTVTSCNTGYRQEGNTCVLNTSSCVSGDGNCQIGCAYPSDTDCNQCNTITDCPTGTTCQTRTCTGTPKRCSLTTTTSCIAGDSCCPTSCTYASGDTDCPNTNPSSGFVVNYQNTDITDIPSCWITEAKETLKIAYSHASHGSQLVTGMEVLASDYSSSLNFMRGNDWTTWDTSKLNIREYQGWGGGEMFPGVTVASDISHTLYTWADLTRTYLDGNSDGGKGSNVNVMIWSWCGTSYYYSSSGTYHEITLSEVQTYYLDKMNDLINEYNGENKRKVTFVLMTIHVGGSESINTLIRDWCSDHSDNCILFDFADMEEHDPLGNLYANLDVTASLRYYCNGGLNCNWATNYLNNYNNLNNDLTQSLKTRFTSTKNDICQHSPEVTYNSAYTESYLKSGESRDSALNCVLKGQAAWYLWARIAGWDGNPSSGCN